MKKGSKRSWSLRPKDVKPTVGEDGIQAAKEPARTSVSDAFLAEQMGLNEPLFDYEGKVTSKEAKKDPLRTALLSVPRDDVVVTHIKRAEAVVPREVEEAEGALGSGAAAERRMWIPARCSFFRQDLVRVDRQYRGSVPTQDPQRVANIVKELPVLKFLKDVGTEEKRKRVQSEINRADPISEQLTKPIPHSERKAARLENRHNLFHLFTGANEYLLEKPVEQHPPFKNATPNTKYVLIKPEELKFELQPIEPLFCSMAIYDFEAQKRVSENFYFHIIEQVIKMNLPSGMITSGPRAKKALFTVSHPNPNLFLVLRIEKVLQGDVEANAEPYIKHDSMKERDLEKAVNNVKSACERMGRYRQPFAYGILPLFGDDGQLAFDEKTPPKIHQLYRTKEHDINDASFLSVFADQSKTGSAKRMRQIPGHCLFEVELVADPAAITPRLDISHAPVGGDCPADVDWVQTMAEMPTLPVLVPLQEYTNLFFLYPDAVNLGSRTQSPAAKNIAIEIEFRDNDDPTKPALARIAPNDGTRELKAVTVSGVTYKSKSPQYYDEIKVMLPPLLRLEHHFLIRFYHVGTQKKAKQVTTPETYVGFTVLQIYPNQRVVSKKQELPICPEEPDQGYLRHFMPDAEPTSSRFYDSGRPLFQAHTKLISSVYTQDAHLNNVLKRLEVPPTDNKSMTHLAKAVSLIPKVHPVRLVQYLPTIMDGIFECMCSKDKDHASLAFKVLHEVLAGLVELLEHEALNVLGSYVDNYVRFVKGKGAYLYEVLTEQWFNATKNGDVKGDSILKCAHFLFKLIFKSMALKVETEDGGLEQKQTSKTRTKRFSSSFVKNLRGLTVVLMWEMQQRASSALTIGKDLAKDIAHFFLDLFSVMDRGVVFKMIEKLVMNIAENDKDLTLIDYKFEFLGILCHYEHLVPLNLPLPDTIESVSKMVTSFEERHFLSSLLIREVTHYQKHPEKSVRMKGMAAIRALFISHDFDVRYDEPERKTRIINVYFPFLLTAIDFQPAESAQHVEARDFFICFLYVLKHVESSLIQQWWKKEIPSRLSGFFDMLNRCVKEFKWRGREELEKRRAETEEAKKGDETKKALENFYSRTGGTKLSYREMKQQQQAQKEANQAAASNASKPSTVGRRGTTRLKGTLKTSDLAEMYQEPMETHLSVEVSYIILDVVESFCEAFQEELQNEDDPFLDKILHLLRKLLKSNQPQSFMSHVYATLRSLLFTCGKRIFGNLSFLQDLCVVVLKHCNSDNLTTRCEASAFLFLMLERGFMNSATFGSVKVQMTIALSRLVEELETDGYMRRALKNVSTYAQKAVEKDKSQTAFAEEVAQLTERLYSILRDFMQINLHEDDIEMKADLHLRIAAGYTNAPELRITWLENLCKLLRGLDRTAEAAMCLVHIAAMMAEYLHLEGQKHGVDPSAPSGCAAFIKVSPNVVEERAPADFNVDNLQSTVVTRHNLIETLKKGITMLTLDSSRLYETANHLYKLLIPMYEADYNYNALKIVHSDLMNVYEHIMESIRTQGRMLGSYYRIGFYGQSFLDLNGSEYIYKEPKITKLSEIKDRLKTLYEKKFGSAGVEIITYARTPNPDELDKRKNYIQITSVEPYFSEDEICPRNTAFEQRNNLTQFSFFTPFTKGGRKAQADDVTQQWMRKTVLTVGKHFPYMTTRLPVVNKTEAEITPLQNCIQNIRSRAKVIKAEAKSEFCSVKTLQPLLQGSLLVMVNEGPVRMCRPFFERKAEFPEEEIAELGKQLQRFLANCSTALVKHKELIRGDQAEYVDLQEKLEGGLTELEGTVQHEFIEGKKPQPKPPSTPAPATPPTEGSESPSSGRE
eukprot:TRINITY_DN2957_c0_g1_i1.p1 TRINITY_DN2957_c0_g1~~TRINITY_DN2957_c0_g1_i1.p1  ORF type:complete len:1831 (-),score=674.61 TRINITY_DN2957_c0_g1_i1:292-5784(-)